MMRCIARITARVIHPPTSSHHVRRALSTRHHALPPLRWSAAIAANHAEYRDQLRSNTDEDDSIAITRTDAYNDSDDEDRAVMEDDDPVDADSGGEASVSPKAQFYQLLNNGDRAAALSLLHAHPRAMPWPVWRTAIHSLHRSKPLSASQLWHYIMAMEENNVDIRVEYIIALIRILIKSSLHHRQYDDVTIVVPWLLQQSSVKSRDYAMLLMISSQMRDVGMTTEIIDSMRRNGVALDSDCYLHLLTLASITRIPATSPMSSMALIDEMEAQQHRVTVKHSRVTITAKHYWLAIKHCNLMLKSTDKSDAGQRSAVWFKMKYYYSKVVVDERAVSTIPLSTIAVMLNAANIMDDRQAFESVLADYEASGRALDTRLAPVILFGLYQFHCTDSVDRAYQYWLKVQSLDLSLPIEIYDLLLLLPQASSLPVAHSIVYSIDRHGLQWSVSVYERLIINYYNHRQFNKMLSTFNTMINIAAVQPSLSIIYLVLCGLYVDRRQNVLVNVWQRCQAYYPELKHSSQIIDLIDPALLQKLRVSVLSSNRQRKFQLPARRESRGHQCSHCQQIKLQSGFNAYQWQMTATKRKCTDCIHSLINESSEFRTIFNSSELFVEEESLSLAVAVGDNPSSISVAPIAPIRTIVRVCSCCRRLRPQQAFAKDQWWEVSSTLRQCNTCRSKDRQSHSHPQGRPREGEERTLAAAEAH